RWMGNLFISCHNAPRSTTRPARGVNWNPSAMVGLAVRLLGCISLLSSQIIPLVIAPQPNAHQVATERTEHCAECELSEPSKLQMRGTEEIHPIARFGLVYQLLEYQIA